MINVAGIIHEDGANGPGLRCTIFVQGCDHKCKGCHSAHTWKFGAGTDMSVDELVDECNKNPLETGITLSGGDPVYQYEPLTTVLERIDPDKHKMLYTGFTKEELELFIYTKERFGRFIEQFDLIVTDPFILEQRDLNLLYRGSKNQRLCIPTWIGESLFIDDITETYDK